MPVAVQSAPPPPSALPRTPQFARYLRYAIRAADHLAGFPTDELRRRWLDGELRRWEDIYGRWLIDPAILPGADEFELSITLALIGKLRAQYAPVPA